MRHYLSRETIVAQSFHDFAVVTRLPLKGWVLLQTRKGSYVCYVVDNEQFRKDITAWACDFNHFLGDVYIFLYEYMKWLTGMVHGRYHMYVPAKGEKFASLAAVR